MSMRPTTVVLITGYPASGKTTFARYLTKEIGLPLLCKDDMKEVLFGTLGWSTVEWKRTLGVTAWALLYRQIEVLLEAHVAHIVEGNFDPKYANLHWQKLTERFDLQLIQVRCECDPLVLLERDRERIQQGKRHPGHILPEDPAFYEMVQKGPMDWISVESERISVDTTLCLVEDYTSIAQRILELSRPNSSP